MARISRSSAALLSALLVIGTVVAVPAAPAGAAGASTVSGRVTDTDGAPLEGIAVTVSSGTVSTQTVTDVAGTYVTEALPEGSYLVSFAQVDGPEPRRPLQYWPKVFASTQASRLELDGVVAAIGIDAELPEPASVGGTVRDVGGTPLGGTCATAWLVDGGQEHWLANVAADPDGTYWIPSLPPGTVRMGFDDCVLPMTWLSSRSDDLELVAGTSTEGVDGVLRPGASIGGTVRDPAGDPVEGICVSDLLRAPDGDEWGPTERTGVDGTFVLSPLTPGMHDLQVVPCGDEPYLPTAIEGLTVASGEQVDGIEVALVDAAVLSGTVRGPDGAAGADVCVQVLGEAVVVGSDRTDVDGRFSVVMAGGSTYTLRVVDCRETPALGQVERTVRIGAAERRSGEDVQLSAASPGSVRGTVSNVRGEPLAGVCVVAYLPFEQVHSTVTAADGSYTLPSLGVGTWSLAFLTCAEDGPDVSPVVVDSSSGVPWMPLWWGGRVLDFPRDGTSRGPDPVADGATLVEVGPGGTAVADQCFGCSALRAEMELDRSTIRASVTADGLDLNGDLSVAADALTYSLTCTTTGEPAVAASVATVSGTDGDGLVLEGVHPDARHRCAVTATLGGVLVASSDEVVLGEAVDAPAGSTGADPSSGRGYSTLPRGLALVG